MEEVSCSDNINSVYCLLSGHETLSTEFSNATEIHCTADFTCVEQLVYSVAWPYTCKSITESRYGINKLFNASEIRCTADFSSVRIFCDCVKRSVASSLALCTTENIQMGSPQQLEST